MIWLVSQNTFEVSTEMVMSWTQHLGGNCQRVNGVDLLGPSAFAIEINNYDDINFKNHLGANVRPVSWYRRWMDISMLTEDLADTAPYDIRDVEKLVRSEFAGLTDAFFQATIKNRWLETAPDIQARPSKMAQLQKAKECGMKIPATIITNNKHELQMFMKKINNNDVIIKPIREIKMVASEAKKVLSTYTKVLSNSLGDVPDNFFPSLFQEAINKVFELRVFYLKGICYAMAIFSQGDERTKDDFRRYNFTKPNRGVPYLLETELMDKIRQFMNSFNMQSGSFDFLVDEHKNIYFLEVNPFGQFGMVSLPCNYYLEREVARHLIAMTDS